MPFSVPGTPGAPGAGGCGGSCPAGCWRRERAVPIQTVTPTERAAMTTRPIKVFFITGIATAAREYHTARMTGVRPLVGCDIRPGIGRRHEHREPDALGSRFRSRWFDGAGQCRHAV